MLNASEASGATTWCARRDQMLPLRGTQGERLIAALHDMSKGLFPGMT